MYDSSADKKLRTYHENYVRTLSVSDRFKKSFLEILKKDSPGFASQFEQKILDAICLDVDDMEIERSKDRQETMDLAFPIGDLNVINRRRFSRERLLLIEFKLNLKGVGFNLSPSKLWNKTSKTRSNFFSGQNIDQHDIFIVPSDRLSIAKNNLFRWQNGSQGSRYKNWLFLDPIKFNTFVSFP